MSAVLDENILEGARRIVSGASGLDEALLHAELSRFKTKIAEPAQPMLEKFQKEEGVDVSGYKVRRHHSCGYGSEYVFHDCAYSFVLCSGEKEVAVVGFQPATGAVRIEQLQGVGGRQDFLHRLKWPAALVNHVCTWARVHKIPNVLVEGAGNNMYVDGALTKLKGMRLCPQSMTMSEALKLSGDAAENLELAARHYRILLPHQAYLRYDVTAKRLGFKKQDDGNYRKRVI